MPSQPDFLGTWFTTFGPLTLEPEGTGLTGVYRFGTSNGRLTGRVEGAELNFSYRDASDTGTGKFRLQRSGHFAGHYKAKGSRHVRRWDGERGFDGVWNTTFGPLRMIEHAREVHGVYGHHGDAALDGTLQGETLAFEYRESKVAGEGRFRLDTDHLGFTGQWRPQGEEEWKPWTGRRLPTDTGATWLVVLEAHWQRDLAEPEYSFGEMLRAVFARREGVRVRHRYFHDAASLEAWCKQLVFLPEPALVVIASHGTPEGLTIRGQLIDTAKVLGCMEHAQSVRLLHFSSCLVAQNGASALEGRAFPVSGYSTSVDWGASAMLEFTYLDMILNRGWDPADAAAALPKLVRYAGDTAPRGSPYPPAGFRFFPGMTT
jgi:hypothetical protein